VRERKNNQEEKRQKKHEKDRKEKVQATQNDHGERKTESPERYVCLVCDHKDR